MIIASRKLEESLGSNLKKVEKNERLTVLLQRRSIRTNRIIKKVHSIIS